MNSRELKAQMVRREIDVDKMCLIIGISRTSWFRKITGKSLFTQGEISSIRDALDLDDQQVIDIFFNKEVS